MGVAAAVRLSRTACSRPLGWLGRRTLQVYVLHLAVLAVVVHLPIGTDLGWAPGTAVLTVAYPALMTALVTVVSSAHRLWRTTGSASCSRLRRRSWTSSAPSAMAIG